MPALTHLESSQWFIGRGLNPRLGDFDIKTFNEMRPGLILWVIFDLAFVAWQHERIGRVTDSMILTVAFHTWYVLDAEYNEVCAVLAVPNPAASELTHPSHAARHLDDHGASLLSERQSGLC